ncbi:MAG TPA: hypothetical protein VFW00_11905 [Rhodocyclaceae bacterium]|nr:hypothetical protein [Rhodocyclaceae bacterium]
MHIEKIGNFNVWLTQAGQYANEMVLLTHGGYKPEWGMTTVGPSVYFYGPHTVTITFAEAWPVIRGTGAGAKVQSILGADSQVWNYNLQKLTDMQQVETMDAWAERIGNAALPNWDWWEADPAGAALTDMKALGTALTGLKARTQHEYQVIHFLCCREWMGDKAPAPFGKLAAPHK